jgi:hypothetical protein
MSKRRRFYSIEKAASPATELNGAINGSRPLVLTGCANAAYINRRMNVSRYITTQELACQKIVFIGKSRG